MEQPRVAQPASDPVSEDVAAWVEAWSDRIMRFAYTYTGSWPMAEDVTQDTFVRLYQHRRSGRACHAGWLFTVARHLAVDAHRRARYVLGRQEVLDAGHFSDESLTVRDIVDRLPQTDQQVLWLFYYGDYSMADIATTLGLSPTQVKHRLYRARDHFRQVWRDSDE